MTFERTRSVAGLLMIAAMAAACAKTTPPKAGSENEAIELFQERVKDYVKLHEKLETEIPNFTERGSPEQVEASQRALAERVREARRNAKQGDFFSAPIESLMKRIMADVLSGTGGTNIKGSIMDENPGLPAMTINERFPSSVPLSTMPPEVLLRLPKLTGEMEYRFIGRRLILLDTEADIILDFTDNVF